MPENDAAAGELLETLIDYLPKVRLSLVSLYAKLTPFDLQRYPTLFEKIPGGIWNKVTDERFPQADSLVGTPALMVISRLVQDDFLMGRERDDGHIYFVGGVVAHPGELVLPPCPRSSPSGWSSRASSLTLSRACTGFYDFSQKINKSMEQIHVGVPQFNEKILKSVERTLKRFEAHQPFERSSWEMVDDYNLYHRKLSSSLTV